MSGFLINTGVTPISWSGNNYQVPTGKILCITNFGRQQSLYIDNILIESGAGSEYVLGSPIIVNANQIVNPTNGVFNGYLVDDDFFSSSSSSGSGSNSTIDSTTIANLGFIAGNNDTQIDSTGIANLGYVAGPKTIDTDTDTQLDSTGIAALGYVAGPKTIDTDTQLDSAGVANYGFID